MNLIITLVKNNIIVLLAIIFVTINSVTDIQANKFIVLDIGQGDATLISLEGKNILIDTGADDSIVFKLPQYLNYNLKLDYVIITHPHMDHIGGIYDLLKRYQIGTLVVSSLALQDIKISNLHVPKYIVNGITEIKIGNYNINIIGSCANGNTLNNQSLVVEIISNSEKLLVMGDAEVSEEKCLFDSKLIEDINILKAGHHCSNTSSSQTLLDIVSPTEIVCSVGKDNKFGHPGKDTIKRFEKAKLNYWVTWKKGDYIKLL